MAGSEAENELSHAPWLFDWWRSNVRIRCNGAAVCQFELSTDINIHSDGRDCRARRHQPQTWADAPRTENHTGHRRRIARAIQRSRSEHGPQ